MVHSGPAAKPSATPEKTDTESLILKILADGGSKDLIEIRSELQTTTTEFVDLNTVTKACDQLVDQGKLKRTGTGEFFAQYSLA